MEPQQPITPMAATGASQFFEPPLSETPSPKPQAPEKFQISNTKGRNQMPGQTARRSVFDLGIWCFFEAWSLGIWSFLPGLSASQNREAPAHHSHRFRSLFLKGLQRSFVS